MRVDKFPQKLVPEFAEPGKSTGWAFTDAVKLRDCPKCGCHKGFHCQTPKGRETAHPHKERVHVEPDHAGDA